MEPEHYLSFAVEVQNESTGVWNRGYIMDKKEDSFLVDFFIEDFTPSLYIPRSRLWMPRRSVFHAAMLERRASGGKPKVPMVGDEVEVLFRASANEALTWFPAIVVSYLESRHVMFVRLEARNAGHIVPVTDEHVAKKGDRLPVKVDHFRKESFRLPSIDAFLQTEKVCMGHWHRVTAGIKWVRKDGDMVEGIVDYTINKFYLEDVAIIQGPGGGRLLESRVAQSYQHWRSSFPPVFWHGEPMRQHELFENHSDLITPRSIFHKRPLSPRQNTMSHGMAADILDLVPNELLIRIFQYLDVVDQRVFRRVSSRFDLVLRTELVQRRLILKLARFDGWDSSSGESPGSVHTSLQCVYTLFLTLSPAVKHLVLLAEGVHKFYGRIPVLVAGFMKTIYACVKQSGTKLKTITVASATFTFDSTPEDKQLHLFPHDLSDIADFVRWENVSFRLSALSAVLDAPVIMLRSEQMDLTSHEKVETALLEMLDAACGEYSPEMRLNARTKVREAAESASRVSSYRSSSPLDAVLKCVEFTDDDEWDSEEEFVALRPLYLMYLVWSAEKELSRHSLNRIS